MLNDFSVGYQGAKRTFSKQPAAGSKGNDLEQFKRSGTQVIVYPKELASGKLRYPYSQ
jgi:hypothetical protein